MTARQWPADPVLDSIDPDVLRQMVDALEAADPGAVLQHTDRLVVIRIIWPIMRAAVTGPAGSGPARAVGSPFDPGPGWELDDLTSRAAETVVQSHPDGTSTRWRRMKGPF